MSLVGWTCTTSRVKLVRLLWLQHYNQDEERCDGNIEAIHEFFFCFVFFLQGIFLMEFMERIGLGCARSGWVGSLLCNVYVFTHSYTSPILSYGIIDIRVFISSHLRWSRGTWIWQQIDIWTGPGWVVGRSVRINDLVT